MLFEQNFILLDFLFKVALAIRGSVERGLIRCFMLCTFVFLSEFFIRWEVEFTKFVKILLFLVEIYLRSIVTELTSFGRGFGWSVGGMLSLFY